MENEHPTLEQAERRVWRLISMAVVIILYLTLILLGLFVASDTALGGAEPFSSKLSRYSLFLAAMVLIFCAYLILQRRKLLLFSREMDQQKRVSETLSRNVEILSALLEVSSSINSQRQLQDILNTITKEMLSCFRADHSSIMLVDSDSQMLRTKASFGRDAQFAQNAFIPIGKSVAGWVVANSQPLLLNGQADASRFPGLPRKSSRNISSSLCVPLTLEDKSIGVLNVNLVDSDRTFTENDLKLLTIFANNAAVAIHNSMLLKEKSHRIRLETMLGQLHSPQVVQKLVERYEENTRPTRIREKTVITILFSDIRGFSSTLSEVAPDDIMEFLDDFYSLMNKAVFDHQGSIDKFIGDEVMAFFGAPIMLKNCTKAGLCAALSMMEYFEELKTRFATRADVFSRLGLGIGLNTGEVVVGNVGGRSRYEYTVIGTTVNLARRLCAYAGPGQILTTESTLEKANGYVSSVQMDSISFKGIPESVIVHRVEGENKHVEKPA
ncbi:MAG: GAF domain-containing protein [Deltaproteobacteria bacterium]|nr:GAF domain-containing protein [Deltaproteobacteria bacterium]